MTVSYYLEDESNVKLEIYNAIGQRVYQLENASLKQEKGWHYQTFFLQGQNFKTGIYFIRLSIEGKENLTKVAVAK